MKGVSHRMNDTIVTHLQANASKSIEAGLGAVRETVNRA
jgi:hypothetical protein